MTHLIMLGQMVIKIVGDSQDLDKAIKNTKKLMQDLGSSLNTAAAQIDSSITTVFEGAAAAVGALGAAAVVTGSQFEAAMTRVQAVSGATAQQMAELTDQAREIGKTTQFSAKDAADAMYVLSQAGLDVNQVMKATSDVMILAAGSGLDLDSAAGLVASTLTEFNLSAEQSGRVVDVLTMAANKSLLSMSDLRDALKYAGTAGASFGISLEETVTAVAKFRDLGLAATQAGTAFRTALVRLADPPKAARKVLDELHLTLSQVNPELVGFEGGMKALAAAGLNSTQAMELFGKVSGASINLLIDQFRRGTDGFDELQHSLENSAGSAGRIFEKMQNTVSAQFQILRNKVADILISLFQDAQPALMRLIDGLQRRVGVLADYVNGSSAEVGDAVNTLVDGILRLTDDLILLLPRIKEIGAALLLMFAVAKVYEFIAAIAALTNALGANLVRAIGLVIAEFLALDAATAFLAVVTGAGALVVGVGLLVALIAKLTDKLSGAADEAQKLAIGLKAAGLVKESEDAEAARLQKLIDLQKADNAVKAAAGLAVSDQAQAIADLTGAQALQEIQAGRLIEMQDKLYSTAKAPILQLRQQAAELQMTAAAYKNTAEKAQGLVDLFNEQSTAMSLTGDTSRFFEVASKQLGVTVSSYEDLSAVVGEYSQRSAQANVQAGKLTDAITKQQIAAADAAKNQKKNSNALDDGEDADKKAAKRLDDLTKKLEDMTAAADPGYAAWIKLKRAIDEVNEAEALGVDAALITKARSAAMDDFNRALSAIDGRFLSIEQAAKLADGGIQVVSDGIDELTSTRLTNMFAAFTAAETKTGTWTKALTGLGGVLGKLTAKTGMDFTKVQEGLTKLGASADQFFAALVGGSGGGAGAAVSGMLGAATGGVGALAGIALAGLEQVAQTLMKGAGDAIMKWLQALPSAIGNVISAITDLSGVLDFAGVFTTATQGLKDWNDQVAAGKGDIDALHDQIEMYSYLLDYETENYKGKGKTKKDRRQDKKDYLQGIRDTIGGLEDQAASAAGTQKDLESNKPKGPAAAETQKILDQVDWVVGFVKAIPKILTALERELPKLLGAMAAGLPKTINRLARAAIPIIKEITDAFAKALQHSDQLIHAFTALAEAFMFLLVYSMPVLTEALIGMLPMLITALIEDLPRLIVEFTILLGPAIVAGFVAAIPGMAKQIKHGLKDAMKFLANHWLEIITFGISDLFTDGGHGKGGKEKDSGFFSSIGKWFDHVLHPSRNARGMQYVPRTMATVLEPGESVFDRASTQAIAKGTFYPPAPMGGGGGMSPLMAQLLVALDGQVVDAAQYTSMQRGHMPKMQRAIRSGRGVKVGFNPGRGSFYG